MKKKHRDIKVGGKVYGWIVKGYGSAVEIFQDKKLILTTDVKTSSDNYHAITPSMVEKIIKEKIIKS